MVFLRIQLLQLKHSEKMKRGGKGIDEKEKWQQNIHWEKFLGTVTRNLVVKIVFNNIFRVPITWSFS